MATNDELIADALTATRERRAVEFKREFVPSAPGAWLEILKDIAAIANSGGGVIVVGLNNDGAPSGVEPAELLKTDLADVVNIFQKYTGEQFDDFEICEAKKKRHRLAVIIVRARAGSPVVFEKPGTYKVEDGVQQQKTAFSRGTVYFRHGAKSEPGVARDIARFVTRELQRQRRDWLKNVRKVAAAPRGAEVLVVPARGSRSLDATNVRIVTDPNAPVVGMASADITHPYRQTDAIKRFNERIGKKVVGPFEIQCVRKTHDVAARLDFFHKPRFSSPQYSDAYIEWLLEEYAKDARFFELAKDHVRRERSRPSQRDEA